MANSVEHTLYRDGIVYFVALFLICLINVVFLLKEFNSPYFYIATEHQRVLHSIFASRVIINVRKAFPVTEVVSGKPGGSFCGRLTENIDLGSGVFVDLNHASQRIEDSDEWGERQLVESGCLNRREGGIINGGRSGRSNGDPVNDPRVGRQLDRVQL